MHISDNGQYLGSAVANAQGAFVFRMPNFVEGAHDYWVMATAPWPDQLNGVWTTADYNGFSNVIGKA